MKNCKQKFLSIIFAAMLLIPSAAFAEGPDSLDANCDYSYLAFGDGEKLEYKVYYNWTAIWLKAGYVDFEVEESTYEGQSAFHFSSYGRTARSYDWLFKVRDKYESYVDVATLLPYNFKRDIREGDYTKQLSYSFAHDNPSVNVDYFYRKGKLKYENESMDISSCAQDMLSSLYYLRCIDITGSNVGDIISFDLFMDAKMHTISVKYLGKDTLETDLGTFATFKISPHLIAGKVFSDEEGMTIHVSDDENKLPLFIESPLSVGKVKVYLSKYKNLKHQLTSKVSK